MLLFYIIKNAGNLRITCIFCWLLARNPIADASKKGSLSYELYKDVEGNDAYIGVYVPANYDANKAYPLVIVSHGGGGNEADWFTWPAMFEYFAENTLWK